MHPLTCLHHREAMEWFRLCQHFETCQNKTKDEILIISGTLINYGSVCIAM